MRYRLLVAILSILCVFAAAALIDIWSGHTSYSPSSSWHNSALAQAPDTPTPVPTPEQIEEELPSFHLDVAVDPSKHSKLDSNLTQLVSPSEIRSSFSAPGQAGQHGPLYGELGLSAASSSPRGEQVVEVIFYIEEGAAQHISDYLEGNGTSVLGQGSDYVEASVPVSLLPDASEREGVISVFTSIPLEPAQGADAGAVAGVHAASAWHSAGYKGKGVKIGIIDYGFVGFRSLMGTELPATVIAYCPGGSRNIADCEGGKWGNHGTAVTEAIFDIAPEATYYIARPSGSMSAAVNWMISEGVDIINFSGYSMWDGSGNGTSPYSWSLLRYVDRAASNGILWVNSAGNFGRKTWFGKFKDANNDRYHEFGGTDSCNTMTLQAGKRYRFQLRWGWGWDATNLNLYLNRVINGRTYRVDSSTNWSRPFEYISYTPSVSGKYCMRVRRYKGPEPAWLQFQVFGGKMRELEHYTKEGGITNPGESRNPGMLAVGAAPMDDIFTIAGFSSQGPTPDGRLKPDIVGPDNVPSASKGQWRGTSQSSPFVAGLAALVKQRFPAYSPQQIAAYLKNGAEARGGAHNNIWGYGFAKLPSPQSSSVASQTIAHAGEDMLTVPLSTATLDGTKSKDPNGRKWWKMKYEWTQLSGPAATVHYPNRGRTTVAVPDGALGAKLEFQLKVTTQEGVSETDTMMMTLSLDVASPTAKAGDDMSAAPGETVTLRGDGSVNSYENTWRGRMSYKWEQTSGARAAFDGNSANTTFTVPEEARHDEALEFRLTVTTRQGATDSDTVTVSVMRAGEPTPTPSATYTPAPTATYTPTPTATYTPVPTATYTPAATATYTPVPTATYTPAPTATYTPVPTATYTPTPTPTATYTSIPTATYTSIPTATYTPTPTATYTPVHTATYTPTPTATYTPVPTATYTPTAEHGIPTACAGPDLTGAPGTEVTLEGKCSTNPYGAWWQMAHQWTQISGPTVTLTHPFESRYNQPADKFGDPRFIVPADASAGTTFVFRLTVTDREGRTDSDTVTVNLTDVDEVLPVTDCFTTVGSLSETTEYAGAWDGADCKAHHQDSRGRYFHFTLDTDTTVSINLSAGALYVSKDTPQNGWGTTPNGTYEDRLRIRRDNGKLVHDGNNTVTLNLESGTTYTVEAAGNPGDFTIIFAPQ